MTEDETVEDIMKREEAEAELEGYESCGRWLDGKLLPVGLCRHAGSEDCEWDCPLNGDSQ